MQMQAVLDDWMANAEEHASMNRAFLRSLDRRAEKAIDRTARRLHREAFAAIDCTRCANCCKTMVPSFTEDEVREIAEHLHVDHEAFVAAYLVRSSHDNRLRPGQPLSVSGRRRSLLDLRDATGLVQRLPAHESGSFRFGVRRPFRERHALPGRLLRDRADEGQRSEMKTPR